MACDNDDREGKSPSPMEPRLGRMFHSSATGRRREQTLPEALGLRQALQPRDDTAGSAGSEARTTRSRCSPPNLDREPSPDARPNSRTDRIRGDGRPVPERARIQDPQATPTAFRPRERAFLVPRGSLRGKIVAAPCGLPDRWACGSAARSHPATCRRARRGASRPDRRLSRRRSVVGNYVQIVDASCRTDSTARWLPTARAGRCSAHGRNLGSTSPSRGS